MIRFRDGARLRRMACALGVLLGAMLAATAIPTGAQPVAAPRESIAAEGVPVEIWQRRIAVLRATIEGASPAVRAARAERKIQDIPPERPSYAIQTLPITLGPYAGIALVHEGKVLFGIAREDLDPQEGLSLEQAGARAARNIETWLALREEQQNPRLFVRHLLVVLASTVLFVLALFGAVRLADYWHERRSAAATDKTRRILIAGVDFRPYLITLEVGIVKLAAWGIYLGLTYLWLTVALAEFPYTRTLSERLAGFLAETLGGFGKAILGAIPDLFAIVVIVMIARLIAAVVNGFFRTVARGGVHLSWLQPETAHVTRRIFVVVIWLFAIVMAYPYIPGSDSEAFKGLSVLIGLMVSLGSAGLVGQVMGGFVVVYNRALRIGEWVRIGEHEGRVTEIGMLSTRLLTPRNEEITIPNAVLIGATTTNYSRRAKDLGSIVSTSVTIGYDAPWREVQTMLLEAAKRTAGVRAEPAPRVLQRMLHDFYVQYDLLVPIEDVRARYVTLSELHANIQDVFNEHGVQIMSPHFVAQPEQAVLVPKENRAPPPEATPAG
ncbi:MAG: mechanosensitive ion channel [Burkholderiales bacterium]|nr:mechanosensitive ion channel [Burkholderiales bacterium]